jgi:hypothetical protein
MFRRRTAGVFVALWFVLLGIDFSGDVGLIQNYRGSETDRAVDSVLTAYEQATDISNDTPVLISPILATQFADFSAPLNNCISTDCTNTEKLLSKEEIPVYKLHLAFLI